MTGSTNAMSRFACAAIFTFGTIAATGIAADLSKYRDLRFGSELPAVAKQIGASSTETKVIHNRPALIQELVWRPQSLGTPAQVEPVKEVSLRFFEGALYRIAVDYDRYETEGLTADDIVEAISANYGPAKPMMTAKVAPNPCGDQEELLARWQNSDYRFDLVRTGYGSSFRLTGVLERLEGPAQAATLEAIRLDALDAPRRDAARAASEGEVTKAKLNKARQINKSKFRP